MNYDTPTHETTGTFCPQCHAHLKRVIGSNLQFCNNSSCDYEFTPGDTHMEPLTREDIIRETKSKALAQCFLHLDRLPGEFKSPEVLAAKAYIKSEWQFIARKGVKTDSEGRKA